MQVVNTNPLAKSYQIGSLLRFASPAIGMMIVTALYTVTDGIFIGRFAGSDALAASNIVYPLFNLILGLSIMLASGGSALVARTLGEGNRPLACNRFSLITLTAVIIGFLLAIFIFTFKQSLLELVGASTALYGLCEDYLLALLPFFPTTALMLIFNAFFIADGRPIQGFAVSVISGLTNALLDYIFLAHLGLGIWGAGVATGAAHFIAAIIGLIYFSRFSRLLRLCGPSLEWRALWETFSNGISELVTEVSIGITTFLFNLTTFAWAGADGVAAITIILYAEMLMTSIIVGFSNGVAPLFSYQFGAKNYPKVLHLLKLALLILTAFAIIVFSLAQILAEPLILLFLPNGGNAYQITYDGFKIFSFSFLLVGFNIFTSSFFTAISDGKTSALASFVRNLAGVVIFIMVLPKLFGFNGVWLTIPVTDLTAAILAAILLNKQRNVFLKNHS